MTEEHMRSHGEVPYPMWSGHVERRAPRRFRGERPEAHLAPRVRDDMARAACATQLCCCDCGRLAASPSHGVADLCLLIGWSYDSGVATCVRCQWGRGETPLFARRAAVFEATPPLRSPLRRVLAWLAGAPSPAAS